MRKKIVSRLSLTLLGLVSVASASPPTPSLWEDCSFENFSMLMNSPNFVWIDPLPGYEDGFCASIPVTGTLKGSMISCFRNDDFKPADDTFGDGEFRYYVIKAIAIFETNGGKIFGTEWVWYDIDTNIQTSLFQITDGEGKYEGATGEFVFHPAWQRDRNVGFGSGYVCLPKQ